MRNSSAIGIFFGVLVTVSAGYYLKSSGLLQGSPRTKRSGPTEPAVLPLASIVDGFNPRFAGHDDLLTRMVNVQPKISVEEWTAAFDSNQATSVRSVRTSSLCRELVPAAAIYLSPRQIEKLRSGAINVIPVIDAPPAPCLVSGSRIPVAVEELAQPSRVYQFAGFVTIERLIEAPLSEWPDAFFTASKVTRADFGFWVNMTAQLKGFFRRAGTPVLLALLKFDPQLPSLDATTIPSFFPGAHFVKPADLNRFVDLSLNVPPLIFADTRAPAAFARGSWNDSVNVPFIPSSPAQLQFQIDMPYSLLVGSRTDISAISEFRRQPIALFGQNERDPSPLWVARQLRLEGFRTLIIVQGGLDALLKNDAP